MMEAVWTLGAESDVQSAYERLEDWEEGTGDRLYEQVLSSVSLLETFPEIGTVVHRNKIRRVLVFNRHYGLYYARENRRLIIHALLDLRQDPQTIAGRIKQL